jgi:hypothetical protein
MFSRGLQHGVLFAATIAVSWGMAGTLRAAPPLSRSFNGPETVWELVDGGVPAKMLAHECIPGGARDTGGIERVAVAATAGQSVLIRCAAPPLAVVDELQIRLWVKSNRSDIQLAARVALPRSAGGDGKSAPLAVIKGESYNRPGHWQQLTLSDVPKLLAAQVRVMRTMQSAVDAHEAYLESVVLVIPGDPNGVEVGTDDLEVDGVAIDPTKIAKPTAVKATKATNVLRSTPRPESPTFGVSMPPAVRKGASATSPARLQGSTLMVEEKPFYPRAIRWSGEPLKFLAERGFNTVQLAAMPTAEQIDDAKRYGLWFICVPPRPEVIVSNGLGSEGDRILAWDLEDEAIASDPSYASRWADAIREHDALYGRPIVTATDINSMSAGKCADVLLARNPRVSRLSEQEFETWLASRPRLARPGTPIWTTINSQFGETVRVQANALAKTTGPAPAVDVEQLETLLQGACMAGVRGVLFQSSSSLSDTDIATRNRAAELELINWRLQLMEPWLAGGKVVSRVKSADGTYDSIVMYVDRSRLLLPVAAVAAPGAAPKRSASKDITFVVPGVSESSQGYLVTPVSMSAISPQRVAGGTRVTIPASASSLVVLTEDPQVVKGFRARIARQGNQTAKLERDFVVARSQAAFEIDRRVAALGLKPSLNPADAATVNARLGQLDSLLSSGQLEEGQGQIDAVASDIRHMVTEEQRAAGVSGGLLSNALGLSYVRLADFATLNRSFENLRGGENLLAGGDFENLSEMTQIGWQHVVDPTTGAGTRAELSTNQPEQGAYCLELAAEAPANGQAIDIASPRVWIVSPPASLEADKTVEITGWIRIDEPFAIAGEGLTVIDSLGGTELAITTGTTSGWQMFRMVRAVPQPTDLRLTFALTGVGSAKVDAVMVRTLEQPVARRLPAVASASTAQVPSVAPAYPIFGPPRAR